MATIASLEKEQLAAAVIERQRAASPRFSFFHAQISYNAALYEPDKIPADFQYAADGRRYFSRLFA